MPNLGEEATKTVLEAARELHPTRPDLSKELVAMTEEPEWPDPDDVPDVLEGLFGKKLAYTKGNESSEEWARELYRRHENLRHTVWAVLLSRIDRGVTAREVVNLLFLDPGEALNPVRRTVQEFREAGLLEKAGKRTLAGRNRSETVRRLCPPVRAFVKGDHGQETLPI